MMSGMHSLISSIALSGLQRIFSHIGGYTHVCNHTALSGQQQTTNLTYHSSSHRDDRSQTGVSTPGIGMTNHKLDVPFNVPSGRLITDGGANPRHRGKNIVFFLRPTRFFIFVRYMILQLHHENSY